MVSVFIHLSGDNLESETCMAQPKKVPKKLNRFDKILAAFRLSEPAQVILVIGILLLLFWILSNPYVLQGIIKAMQLWFVAKGIFNYLLSS